MLLTLSPLLIEMFDDLLVPVPAPVLCRDSIMEMDCVEKKHFVKCAALEEGGVFANSEVTCAMISVENAMCTVNWGLDSVLLPSCIRQSV